MTHRLSSEVEQRNDSHIHNSLDQVKSHDIDNDCIISKYAVYSSGVMSSWSSSVTFEYDTGFPLTEEHLNIEITREENMHTVYNWIILRFSITSSTTVSSPLHIIIPKSKTIHIRSGFIRYRFHRPNAICTRACIHRPIHICIWTGLRYFSSPITCSINIFPTPTPLSIFIQRFQVFNIWFFILFLFQIY